MNIVERSGDLVRNFFRSRVLSLFFLLALAAVARGLFLGRVGLWHDPAVAHYYALQSPGWIIKNCATWINHPPLFFLLLHGWLKVVPRFNQVIVELFNLAFALGAVFVFYSWLRNYFAPRYAFLGGFVFALNPFHVYYSFELRMYSLAVFALTATVYFTSRIFQNRGQKLTSWLGWVLASLVGLYTHSFTGLFLLVVGLTVGWQSYKYGYVKAWLFAAGAIIIGYSPWGFFVVRQALRISGEYWLPPFRGSYPLDLFYLLAGYIGPRFSGLWALGTFGLLWTVFLYPLLVSLTELRNRVVLLSWLVIMLPLMLVVGLSLFGQSVFLYRVFIPLLPFVLFLLIVGYRKFREPVGLVLVGIYSVFLVLQLGGLYFNPPHQYVKRVARRVEAMVDQRTKVVHTSRFTFYPDLFYHSYSFSEYIIGDKKQRYYVEPEKVKQWLNQERVLLVTKPGFRWKKMISESNTEILKNVEHEWSNRKFQFILTVPET